MAKIQKRDILIFRSMRHGPRTIKGIYGTFHRHREAEEFKLNMSSLVQRLHILGKDDFVKSRLYNLDLLGISSRALYCLADRAIEELVKNTNIDVESIRSNLPARHLAIHELLISSILDTIDQQSMKGAFSYEFWDERLFRRRKQKFIHDLHPPNQPDLAKRRKKRKKRKIVFPDLGVEINHFGNRYHFKVELDRGTIPAHQFARKINLLSTEENSMLLVICEKKRRLDILKKALRERTNAMVFRKGESILFGLFNEFRSNGIFNNNIFTNAYDQVMRIELPYKAQANSSKG